MDDYRLTKTALKCLGRQDLAFDFDLDDEFDPTGYIGCPASSDNVSLWNVVLCQTSFLITYLICCNLLDVYLLAKCFQLTREQTDSVKSLMSLENFEMRKRSVVFILII